MPKPPIVERRQVEPAFVGALARTQGRGRRIRAVAIVLVAVTVGAVAGLVAFRVTRDPLAVAPVTATEVTTRPAQAGIEDQNDRLLRSLQARQAERTQAAVERYRSMERNASAATTVAASTPRTRTQDQADQRRALYQAELEHNLAAAAAAGAATQAAARPATSRGVDPLVTLLAGLTGGLVGGGAAIAGWILATRRRMHRAAAAS